MNSRTIKQSSNQAIKHLKDTIESGEKIPGFGHPLFYKDPRTCVLYRLAVTEVTNSAYLKCYKSISNLMCLSINVDAISAAILLALEVDPDIGAILFLWARMPAMIAHSIEKKSRPSFEFKRTEACERLERFSVDCI